MTRMSDKLQLVLAFLKCDAVAQPELLQLTQNFGTRGAAMTPQSIAFALHILERAVNERIEDPSSAYEECVAALGELEYRLPTIAIDLEHAAKTVWAELNPELLAKATREEIDQHWQHAITDWLNQPTDHARGRDDFFKHWLAQPEAAAILGVEDFSVTL